MASKLDPLIAPIITDYRDKGVKAAQKSFLGLEGSAKKLAKAVGIAFSARAIVNFGKASVSAYMADEKAAKSLAAQMSNLGLAIDSIGAENFIQQLQTQTGVLDDQLRPAYQRIVSTTLDAAKAQDILNLAMDVSAGTGADLQSTADALSKAYLGNTKGLTGLGVAMSKAELQTSSFEQIQKRLSDLYKGQAATAAETYAGKILKIKAAYADLQEQVGQGIITGFENLIGSNGSIDQATQKMRDFGIIAGQELAGFGTGLRQLFQDLSNMPIVSDLLVAIGQFTKGLDILTGASKAFQQDLKNYNDQIARDNTHKLEIYYRDLAKQNALNKKLAKDQQAAADAALKKKKEALALDKASLMLKQADAVFNLDQIEVAAAMQNKALTLGEMARLQLKKDMYALQDAINNQDAAGATILAAKVNEDLKRLNILQGTNLEMIKMVDLANKIPTNKDLIDLQNLLDAQALIKKLQAQLDALNQTKSQAGQSTFNPSIGAQGGIGITTISPTISSNPAVQNTFETVFNDMAAMGNNQTQSAILALSSARYEALAQAYAGYGKSSSGSITDASSFAGIGGASYSNPSAGGVTVNLTVQGSISTQNDIVNAVIDGIQQQTASGTKTTVNRLDPAYL